VSAVKVGLKSISEIIEAGSLEGSLGLAAVPGIKKKESFGLRFSICAV